MTTAFSGFLPQTLKFYRDLSRNNNRDWMAEHRSEYLQFVQEPARNLAARLGPMLGELDPDIVTTPTRVVSRINRDTRFSSDKSPYRPRTFLAFRRDVERWSETPAFFLQVEEKQYLFGMGIYGARPATMQRFRAMIDDNPERFIESIQPVLRSRSLVLESEKYKRPFLNVYSETLPAATARKIEPWYQSKSIAVIGYRQPDKVLFSPELVDFLLDRFVCLKPLYDFLWRAIVL